MYRIKRKGPQILWNSRQTGDQPKAQLFMTTNYTFWQREMKKTAGIQF